MIKICSKRSQPVWCIILFSSFSWTVAAIMPFKRLILNNQALLKCSEAHKLLLPRVNTNPSQPYNRSSDSSVLLMNRQTVINLSLQWKVLLILQQGHQGSEKTCHFTPKFHLLACYWSRSCRHGETLSPMSGINSKEPHEQTPMPN